jgi:pyruvate/2-oxoglutarate dehydrogenase complex dihydrolipoamide dehydrogenase (E3) component/uncharacterized membrane protein YdjX (TVP38/TMEM64 family)
MNKRKILLAAAIVAAIAAFFALGLQRYLSLEAFRSERAGFAQLQAAHPLAFAALYFAAYVAVAALSLPGAAIMTLIGGALFGLAAGTLLVSFASSIGAVCAFTLSRFVLRDAVRGRFGDALRRIDAGIRKDGPFYLFALRLVPLFPFFAINLALGLTDLGAWTFYWVSQLGMLPGTVVYVYAGTQLGRFEISGGLVAALAALGLFPLAARRVLEAIKARRVYARWKRPRSYDYNLVVIGAGSAGLVASYIAAATRARVALVEKHRMGGDCLNTGCVPSKALIRSARLLSQIARSGELGIARASAEFDFAEVMERVARVVRAVEPHDSAERYRSLGVDCVSGSARLTSPWTVEVDGPEGTRRLTTRSVVIAAGARPFVPPIPGLHEIGCLTSDTVWELRRRPRRLLVLGGGPIGAELAQAFARLGSEVTLVEMLPRILMREDPEVSRLVTGRFEREGMRVLAGHRAARFAIEQGEKILVAEHAGGEARLAFDEVLVAVGRVANTAGYGLEELGIGVTPQRTIETDEYLQTVYPNIYACGDVAGPYQFTHTASHQAWYAAVNAMFGRLHRVRADYRVIPWATFVDPEVARVGLNEQEAKEKGLAHDVVVYGIDELDRAIADGEAHGFVKVLTAPGSDRILGVTIVGAHAADLLAEFVLAMNNRLGLNRILGAIHVYPTMAEANKYAAGAWKRSQVTLGQWRVLEALQAWMRGAGGVSGVIGALGALRDRRRAYTSAP